MGKMKHLLMVMICFVVVGLLQSNNAVYASTDRTSIHSFYDNPLSKTPDQSINYNGIEYFAIIIVKKKLNKILLIVKFDILIYSIS